MSEATINAAIVAKLEAVAVSSLGFSETNGNIRGYLPQYHQKEQTATYYMTSVNGNNVARVIGVQVTPGNTLEFLTNNQVKMDYGVLIQMFLQVGKNGAGISDLITTMRAIRSAIFAMGTNLSNTTSSFDGMSSGSIDVIDIGELGVASRLLTQSLTFTATDNRGTF